jgi:hypothetical protein
MANLTEIGDLITGTALQHFMREFGKDKFLKDPMITNVNPTGTSYQNVSVQGIKDALQFKAAIPADIWYFWPSPPEMNMYDPSVVILLRNYYPDQNDLTIGILGQPRDKGDVDKNTSPKVIFQMRYQTIAEGQSFTWDIGKVEKGCCGFLDFMVGPLGVMEALDLCGEASGSIDKVLKGGKLLPPAPVYENVFCDIKTGKKITITDGKTTSLDNQELISTHIVSQGYKPGLRVELLAKPLPGEVMPKVHTWIRVKLDKADTLPLPGEFLALLARPVVDFAWFNQLTSPFIVGGNWFHTAAYTSGKVTKIEGNNRYTVKVKGKEIAGIESSDYLEYLVDERVALMHTFPSNSKFAWKDTMSTSSLRIVPITFYQKEGV